MPTCMLCLHATHPHILTMYVHTLPNFERVYAYCIHVRDNIRSEESNMQYLFLEPLQLTMKHLPTPPAYTSDHQRTLWERTHSHSSQSLSLFIDVCVRRKQSLTVFLSPSLNLHLSTYPLRAFCTFTLDSCASACVPKKTKFAAVAPSALSTPGVWRLSIFQGLVGDCVWERIVRGEGERRNHYIYIYIYIYPCE